MRQSARVLSTDALRDFQAALAKYSAKARESLREALMAARHTLDWLEVQLKAWTREAEKRHEEVNRCRAELAVARSAPENWRSAVTDREIDLRRAQARLREAEDRVAAAKRWKRTLPQALNEYELPLRRLGGFLDGDIQHALAVLDAKIEALQNYTALEAACRPHVGSRPDDREGAEAMSLNAASVELTDGIKTLGEVWETTRAVWDDGVAQDFENRFWRPLEGQTNDAVGAIDRLAVLIAQVRRDCT